MISLRLVTFCLFVIACLDFSGCQPNYCLPLQPLLQEIQTNGIGTTGECRCNTSDEFKRLQKEVVQLQSKTPLLKNKILALYHLTRPDDRKRIFLNCEVDTKAVLVIIFFLITCSSSFI